MALTLNKQTVNLGIDQGCTFEKVITAQNTAGSNVSISSGTVAAKLRHSKFSSNNIQNFSTSVSGSTTHWLKDTLDYKMGLMIVIGGAAGTIIGVITYTF